MTFYLPTCKGVALVAMGMVLCSCGGGNEPSVSVLQAPAAQRALCAR